MGSTNEIKIHLFDASEDTFQKIFKSQGEIMRKEFGKIEKRFLRVDKDRFLKFFPTFSKQTWAGYKYPKRDRQDFQRAQHF